jgi:hypothetical protein
MKVSVHILDSAALGAEGVRDKPSARSWAYHTAKIAGLLIDFSYRADTVLRRTATLELFDI